MRVRKLAPRRRALPAPAQWAILVGTAALLVVAIGLLTSYIPFASDWRDYYQPITRGWLDGSLVLYEDTQWGGGFWSPPWLLWALIPLAAWPTWVGWGILVVATLVVMIWLTRDYRNQWLVFTTPLIIDLILDAPVEIVPMLGIALGWLAADRPYLLGVALVLMATRPQTCFLFALWLLIHHRHRLQALVIPISVFLASLAIHGWDWPIRWASGPSIWTVMGYDNNVSPWRSLGLWMAPVAVVLGLWALRLPRTRRNMGALVAANALIAPFLGSYSLIHVLTFSLLPLGAAWAAAGWLASCTVFLRFWFGQRAVSTDFAIAAVLTIGYLLCADRHPRRSLTEEAQP